VITLKSNQLFFISEFFPLKISHREFVLRTIENIVNKKPKLKTKEELGN
jgi:hypothetical protein